MAEKDLNKLEKQEDRSIRRQAKKDIKDYQLGQDIASEAKSYGIDLNKPTDIGPLTQQRKEQIDKDILSAIDESRRGTLQKIQGLYQAPKQQQLPELNQEALKKSLQKEKRAKIIDALTAIGRGMQGKSIDPSQFISSQLSEGRKAQYEQYKQARDLSQKRSQEWEEGYRNRMIGYLEDQLKQDPAMSDAKKREIEARINKLNIEAEWKKKQPYYKPSARQAKEQAGYEDAFYLKGSNPYTSVLYSISEDPESLFPALDKGTYSPTEKEDAAKQIILQMYDIKTDDRGNQYLAPKQGREGYLSEVRSNVERQKQITPIQKDIDQKQDELKIIQDKLDKSWGIEWYDKAKYRNEIQRLEGEIADLESQKQSITGGAPATQPKNTLEDIYSKYR